MARWTEGMESKSPARRGRKPVRPCTRAAEASARTQNCSPAHSHTHGGGATSAEPKEQIRELSKARDLYNMARMQRGLRIWYRSSQR
eukprot:6211479-Pleurochrysis_carterae.AAC.2